MEHPRGEEGQDLIGKMKSLMFSSAIKVALVAAAAFIILNSREALSADYLTGSGCSISNVGYLTELAKEYERLTGTRIYIRGGGSVVGIEDLRNGRVDFAAACRSKEPDDPVDVQFIQVAWDVLVFIVHRNNLLNDISMDNVRSIYAGTITNWKDLNGSNLPIKIFRSKPKRGLSGIEASIRTLVLKGREPEKTPNTLNVASTAIVEQMVEDTPEGFAASGYSSARKRDVKTLKVNGVAPTIRNIINNKYALKRPLYILVHSDPKPEVKKFVDYMLSKQGQEFIRSQGVVSLLDIK